ncbi:hypothetical protein T281_10370 [Rhodomicrobium udaipurense JA643]|uniref:FAD-dependent monooxygenase n=1 Tax=Rhodomicrobium udaipurense TaxID=1202716 RepID=A0A8I1GJ04_9HYPH|nr:FAD-dependent monooxygenase [Rhodomicrobium udaipurense]KAI94551.1 hypothetical protein T281_10370 [Rhodomicrobium udaipurense JA643]MBJ7544387.1 FAD-dependent monooxygenase [Rhodomicrobium udaipurense]
MTNSAQKEKIAIAGAGIAGLSAAIALRLAGHPVDIFEAEPKLQPFGAGIQIGPNATRILESWNVALLGTGFEPENIEIHNARTGSLLNTVPLREAARARYGAPYVTLLRKDLQNALLSRARDLGAVPKYSTPVTGAEMTKDGFQVTAGGRPYTLDALIGADGIGSEVRKFAWGTKQPVSANAVAWRAILPITAVPEAARKNIGVWMATGGHFVHYPVSGGSSLNGVLVLDDDYRNDGEPDRNDPLPYLLHRLEGWAPQVRETVSSTKAWLPWQLRGLEKWDGGHGRVQCIGDAWHAMRPYLASGGVMAIEDGAALASALAGKGSIEAKLARFREKRAARVWQVAERSALIGRIYHVAQPFDVVRDLAIKKSSPAKLLERNDWLYNTRV